MHKILLVEDDQIIRQQIRKTTLRIGALSRFGRRFYGSIEPFCSVKNLIWSSWILVLASFNGYHWCQEIHKISKVPIMFLSSEIRLWILSWRSIWEQMTLWPSLLASRCSLPGSRLVAPILWIWPWWSLLEYAGDSQYQVYGPALSGRKSWATKNEFLLRVLFRTCWQYRSAYYWWENSGIATFSSLTIRQSVNVARLRKKLEEQGLVKLYQSKKGWMLD